MRKLALGALAFTVSTPLYAVIGSSEASAFWDRGPTYVVAPSCARPRGYSSPRIYYAPRVYGVTYGWAGRGWRWGRRGW